MGDGTMSEIEQEKKHPKDAVEPAELQRGAETKLLDDSSSRIASEERTRPEPSSLPKLTLVHDHDEPADKELQPTDLTRPTTKAGEDKTPRSEELESRKATMAFRLPWEKKEPTVKEDENGKNIDYGKGHTRRENKDGTGYDRYLDEKTGNWREEHFGPEAKDKYSVKGDKDGNKTTDWHDGHLKVENADKTGYETRPQIEGGTRTKFWGPKPEDNYTVSEDKDHNKRTYWGGGHWKIENADGTGYERTKNGDGYSEKHWGPKAEDKFKVDEDKDGNKTTTYEDGRRIEENKNGNKTTTYPDGRKIEEDKEGNKKISFPDGHIRVENKDNTGYEKVTASDGTTLETHFGPKPEDKYTVSTDLDGTRKTDWGNGHVKVEGKDGKGYERIPNTDGSYRIEHFGPGEKDKYTEKFDKDGKKITLTDEQLKAATVGKGEGPYQTAERLLGKDASHAEKLALARAFKAAYAIEHPNDKEMKNLKQGEHLLTEKNFEQVLKSLSELKGVKPELAKKIAASLQAK